MFDDVMDIHCGRCETDVEVEVHPTGLPKPWRLTYDCPVCKDTIELAI